MLPPIVGEAPVSSYTCAMTMMDLGPERPGQASDTRQMSEIDRAVHPTRVSGRLFWVTLALILMGVAIFFVVR